MNKAQINFFCERAKIVCNRVKAKHEEKYLGLKELTVGQIAGRISSGNARFRYELFVGDVCPRIGCGTHDALNTFWEIPEQDRIKARNERRHNILREVYKRIEKYRDRLEEDFVMKLIDDPRNVLSDFENMNFFHVSEENTLNEISIRNTEIE